MTSPKRGNIFALALLLFYPVVLIIVSLVIGLIVNGNIISAEKASLVLIVIQDLLILLIPIVIYCLVTKSKLTVLIPHEKLSLKNIFYIIVLTILIAPIIVVISSITTLFYPADINNQILEYIDALPLPLALLALAIMPAVFEELAFRGVLLSNYKSVSLLNSAIVSGLFFGLFHLDFYQMGYAFAVGIFFAFIVRYTNSIYASMLSHFMINGSQVLVTKIALILNSYGMNEVIEQTNETTSSYSSIIIGIFFTVIVTPFLVLIIRKFMEHNKNHKFDYELSITRKEPEEFEIDINSISKKKSSFIDIYFIAYIIVAIIISLILANFK
ncbi:MAG: type II CAAX endopeptidase family protein [Lachnospirales bacterium]